MSQGDVANLSLWADADVWIADVGATLPTDPAAPATGWTALGLLDGSAGSVESQSNDSTDYSAWGKGVVLTSRKNLAITRTVNALEETIDTLGLRYDSSGLTTTSGVTSGDLAARDLARAFLLIFDMVRDGILRRLVTLNHAEIDSIGDVTDSEDALTLTPVTFKVYGDSSTPPKYWRYYRGAVA